jgi:hypothetical protein
MRSYCPVTRKLIEFETLKEHPKTYQSEGAVTHSPDWGIDCEMPRSASGIRDGDEQYANS